MKTLMMTIAAAFILTACGSETQTRKTTQDEEITQNEDLTCESQTALNDTGKEVSAEICFSGEQGLSLFNWGSALDSLIKNYSNTGRANTSYSRTSCTSINGQTSCTNSSSGNCKTTVNGGFIRTVCS